MKATAPYVLPPELARSFADYFSARAPGSGESASAAIELGEKLIHCRREIREQRESRELLALRVAGLPFAANHEHFPRLGQG